MTNLLAPSFEKLKIEIDNKIYCIDSFLEEKVLFSEIDFLLDTSEQAINIFNSSLTLNLDDYFTKYFDILYECVEFKKSIEAKKGFYLNDHEYYISNNPHAEQITDFIKNLKTKIKNLS